MLGNELLPYLKGIVQFKYHSDYKTMYTRDFNSLPVGLQKQGRLIEIRNMNNSTIVEIGY